MKSNVRGTALTVLNLKGDVGRTHTAWLTAAVVPEIHREMAAWLNVAVISGGVFGNYVVSAAVAAGT